MFFRGPFQRLHLLTDHDDVPSKAGQGGKTLVLDNFGVEFQWATPGSGPSSLMSCGVASTVYEADEHVTGGTAAATGFPVNCGGA
jgi:hypothetical protein